MRLLFRARASEPALSSSRLLRCLDSSLSSAEGSSNLEIVADFSGLGLGEDLEVLLDSHLTHNLNVNVLVVIEGKRFSLGLVEQWSSLLECLSESVSLGGLALSELLVVDVPEELVVLLVETELQRVLVVGKESVVSVGQISQVSSLHTSNKYQQQIKYHKLRYQ